MNYHSWKSNRRDTVRFCGSILIYVVSNPRCKSFSFDLLAKHAITEYAPGSPASAIAVFSNDEFRALSSQQVSEIFQRKSILVRGGSPDPFWRWGLEAFSAIRPIHGTMVDVQGLCSPF